MAKPRFGGMAAAAARPASKPGPATTAAAPAANVRVSNGLKEFLWLISDVRNGRILDLGQVSQATLTFFIEKGYRVSTEDFLRSWKEFLTAEEERLRIAPVGEGREKISQAILADKFLETSLRYPEESFHGVLAWDLFDYFDAELMPRVMERLYSLLHPAGSVLALFHSRPAERFHRYRIVDGQSIELLPAPTLAVHARVFRNREILDLFGKFRSSKTFVGRDQLREGLFLK
ncbi:MAG TPA: class I SAM-dependent methyltransferase [Candidatus Limnocylindria bacterium]|nr:class I SAM-dependent methyltransferase [Candidatus Limnocylindria bacterium]